MPNVSIDLTRTPQLITLEDGERYLLQNKSPNIMFLDEKATSGDTDSADALILDSLKFLVFEKQADLFLYAWNAQAADGYMATSTLSVAEAI